MPRKKILPDHSPSSFETKALFTDAFADEQKTEFGIPGHFKLTERLNRVAFKYQWEVVSSPPKISEQRQLLETIHDQAAALNESLQKLGFAEEMRIYESIPGFEPKHLFEIIYGESQFTMRQTKRNIHELKYLTEMALGEIPQKPGRRKDMAFKMLVFRLHELFREATGDDRKLTYNAYGDQYTGPAFGFICKCLPILDIHKDEQAIAAVIKEMVSVQGN